MLSNLVSQLREQNALDNYSQVLEEVPRVRADLGYPPLVTPTSQIVGTQAVLNVLSGVRYKQVTQEVRNYLLGQYGQPPGEVNQEVRRQVTGEEKPIDARPADLIKPELPKLRKEGHKLGIIHREEDLLTYALYPQVALKFLRGEIREEATPSPAEAPAKTSRVTDSPTEFSVDVDGEIFNVRVTSVLGKAIEVQEAKKPAELPAGAVVSPIQGMVLAVKARIGDEVRKGDVLLVIEAMKMQNQVVSPYGGVVKRILTFQGEVVNAGDVLMVVEPEK